MLAWHFLNDEGTLRRGGLKVTPGLTLRMRGKLVMCERGFHASVKSIDALQYAPGSMLCRVKLGGEIIEDTDKVVASERTVLWMADATNTLHEFACWCAENALNLIREKGQELDPRSWGAIEAKRKWLRGEITDEELDAARGAAWDAARGAAWDAARGAAWGAARGAARGSAWGSARGSARDAAWDAAWGSARGSARDAARGSVWDAQNTQLETMLLALEPVNS